MAYVSPKTVISPKRLVKEVRVLYDTGPTETGSWSAAIVEWADARRVGLRWNGGESSPIGSPQSRGQPTWFLVPPELERAVRDAVEELTGAPDASLVAGYRAMAEDRDREAEAHEWTEGLIRDAADPKG